MITLFKILSYAASFFHLEKIFINAALKFEPNLVKIVSEKCKTVFVCGSCGKTSTLIETVSAVKLSGVPCKGKVAKSAQGVLCEMLKFMGEGERYLIFEADADKIESITELVKPVAVAITNIFTDKNPGEDIYKNFENAFSKFDDVIFVLNGDEPMLYNFCEGSRRYFYGFRVNPDFPGGNVRDEESKICPTCNNPYKYIYNTYAHLGNYSCEVCGKTRPQLALGVDRVDALSENGTSVSFDGLEIDIPLAGGSHLYNALCAATLAGAIGVEPQFIKEGIESVKSIKGVYEKVKIDTKELRLIGVGSALDFTESVNSIIKDEGVLYIAILLGRKEEGWLDSIPFEKIINLNYHGILVGGNGRREVISRLESAGLDSAKFIECDDFESFHYAIRTNVIGKTYVFADKKLMNTLRKNLHKKKYIKKL